MLEERQPLESPIPIQDVPQPKIVPEFVPEPAPSSARQTYKPPSVPIAHASMEPSKVTIPMDTKQVTRSVPKVTDSDWRLIGRLQDAMVLFETDAGLVVMHLRAAHQRIVYERIAQEFAQHTVVQQPLLVPIPMEFEPVAAAVLTEHLEFFNAVGFRLECFGRNFYRLSAYPDWLEEKLIEAFVRDLVSEIREKGLDPHKTNLAHDFIARSASLQAVRIDESLSDDAVMAMVNDLMACKLPLACPQGKPTFFELSRSELNKRLGK